MISLFWRKDFEIIRDLRVIEKIEFEEYFNNYLT